jgi:hypothetical protein
MMNLPFRTVRNKIHFNPTVFFLAIIMVVFLAFFLWLELEVGLFSNIWNSYF